MSWFHGALALHMLGVAAWVGGMAFALLVLRVLRAAQAVLAPQQPLALGSQMLRRLFLLTWHAMPVVLLSGYAMLFGALGGFAHANWAVHTMHLLGLIMMAIFIWTIAGPWRKLRAAQGRNDDAGATAEIGRIGGLMRINLLLGVVTIIVAAWAV
jgi:uncharacterized membrane protein